VSWGQVFALAGLGAFHGLNPAMGWLFAVARGMQERSPAVLVRSLPPIALGHLASVAIVAAVVSATESVVAAKVVGVVGGAVSVVDVVGLVPVVGETPVVHLPPAEAVISLFSAFATISDWPGCSA
jgi:hypothetical protein